MNPNYRLYGQFDHSDFPHGTPRGSNLGCRTASPCPATPTCAQAESTRRKQIELNRHLGRPWPSAIVPADDVRDHLQVLFQAGWSLQEICTASGVARLTVQRIVRGFGCRWDAADALKSIAVADLRQTKEFEARHRSPRHIVSAAAARKHLRMLLKVPGASCGVIAECAGLANSVVTSIHAGNYPSIRLASDRKIRAVTREQVMEQVCRVPVTQKIVQLIRSMQVQGWGTKWQSQYYGRTYHWVRGVARGCYSTIYAADAKKIFALAERVEGTWGPDLISAGKARAQGWHPLACYNNAGQLLPGSVRERDKDAARRDREEALQQTARNHLEALRLSLEEGISAGAIGKKLGVDDTQVQRWRTGVGLHFVGIGGTGGGASTSILRRDCTTQARQVMRILAAYHSDPSMDPQEAVRELRALKASLKRQQQGKKAA
ncbi:hypothetical protein AB0395_35055 [Streptosporangium sp. NPDC051023]|uniref:hypothetical protein n=1 Tax=Streptosporangium sp. NPDC051023 TaxID=3155410 RepID=UPI00344E2DFD